MKIGIFVPGVSVPPGRESNVSGHVQIPMESARRLADAGHETHLIGTTRQRHTWVLPQVYPENISLHIITDGKRKSELGAPYRRSKNLVTPVRQVIEMKRLVKRLQLDVLHVFGFSRSAQFGGVLARSGIGVPVVVSILGPVGSDRWQFLGKYLSAVVTATEFVKEQSKDVLPQIQVVRHGIVRDLNKEATEETPSAPLARLSRVLFWREANLQSGADVVAMAFEALAPRYPQVSFDFALRASNREVAGLEDLSEAYDNVHIYRFPYEEGITLARLVSESICIVLPYRALSIHPQLNIAESLAAGIATISTDVGSNAELIESGRNGFLVPLDDYDALVATISRLIEDPDYAEKLGTCAAADFESTWSWTRYSEELLSIYQRALSS